jgi:hypothetical protein
MEVKVNYWYLTEQSSIIKRMLDLRKSAEVKEEHKILASMQDYTKKKINISKRKTL